MLYMDLEQILIKLLKSGWIQKKNSVLVVCGSNHDDEILKRLGFKNRLITSAYDKLPNIKTYQQLDAQKLTFKDNSFDVVLVNLGLHHCASPHQALCEMYRVAKKTVIVHEAQDSLIVRLMTKLGLVLEYEVAKNEYSRGTFAKSRIVNFVYRWTKREVRKTINSFDPSKQHNIQYYSEFSFYDNFLGHGGFWEHKTAVKMLGKTILTRAINFLVFLLNLVASSQGNNFAFIVRKDKSSINPLIKFDSATNFLYRGKFKEIIIKYKE